MNNVVTGMLLSGCIVIYRDHVPCFILVVPQKLLVPDTVLVRYRTVPLTFF